MYLFVSFSQSPDIQVWAQSYEIHSGPFPPPADGPGTNSYATLAVGGG